MNKRHPFHHLLNPDKYQVFLLMSPGVVPFHFAAHPIFVVNKRGELNRWEILFRKNRKEPHHGHLHLNFFPVASGIEIIPYLTKFVWKPKLHSFIEGGDNSTAKQMIDFIENSKDTYPHKHRYFLAGPNSNTWAQWVLDAFPEFDVKLPWNAFGRKFKVIKKASSSKNRRADST